VQWNSTTQKTIQAIRTGELDEQSHAKFHNAVYHKKIIFLAISSFLYRDWILKVNACLSGEFQKIGYVSFVWPPQILLKDFQSYNQKHKDKILEKKYFFIDGSKQARQEKKDEAKIMGRLTQLLTGEKKTANKLTEFQDLNQLSRQITCYLTQEHAQATVIDTLSMLTYYWRDNMQVLRFAHTLIQELLSQDITCIFPFPIETESMELARDLQMFADSVLILK